MKNILYIYFMEDKIDSNHTYKQVGKNLKKTKH
jgi:hypothetical protein